MKNLNDKIEYEVSNHTRTTPSAMDLPEMKNELRFDILRITSEDILQTTEELSVSVYSSFFK
jgi:hypothetical protein